MAPDEFRRRLEAVAELAERPITAGTTAYSSYKDYGSVTIAKLRPCVGACRDCGLEGACDAVKAHQRRILESGEGWQSYCKKCRLYKNRVTGRYEIRSSLGKKTIL